MATEQQGYQVLTSLTFFFLFWSYRTGLHELKITASQMHPKNYHKLTTLLTSPFWHRETGSLAAALILPAVFPGDEGENHAAGINGRLQFKRAHLKTASAMNSFITQQKTP